jgi:hypothetical protein
MLQNPHILRAQLGPLHFWPEDNLEGTWGLET